MPPGRFRKFPAYVSAEQRRARAAAAAARLGKREEGAHPIRIEGKDITSTFWGKAWCENLQSYADFAYRLDRGRSYLRAGAVVDLKISPGQVAAQVVGSTLYQVDIAITALEAPRWREIARASSGRISSLVALLRGELHDDVLRAVTDRETGLFPKPGQMQMRCTCPDSAILCKHVAATLYGVGARLDTSPELLFRLRGVDAKDLLDHATATLAAPAPGTSSPRLTAGLEDLGALFGIDLVGAPTDDGPAAAPTRPKKRAVKPMSPASKGKPTRPRKPTSRRSKPSKKPPPRR